jgi:hypothetical protein
MQAKITNRCIIDNKMKRIINDYEQPQCHPNWFFIRKTVIGAFFAPID